MHRISLFTCLLVCMAGVARAQALFEADVLKTSAGEVTMTFIGHGSLWFAFGGKIIHVDPWGKLADYSKQPKADVILVTHEHPDHFDPVAIRALRGSHTVVLLTAACAERLPGGTILKNGDVQTVAGDTENTPEMKQLANIDVAFLPMNLPYTMTPAMVADAVRVG